MMVSPYDEYADKRYILLDISLSAFLFYRLYLETTMISEFENKPSFNILNQISKYSNSLKADKDICSIVSKIYADGRYKQNEGFNKSYIKYACMNIRGGIADDGSTNSLDNYFSNLMDEYIDFAQKHDNIKDIITYLSSDLYLSILNDIYIMDSHLRISY